VIALANLVVAVLQIWSTVGKQRAKKFKGVNKNNLPVLIPFLMDLSFGVTNLTTSLMILVSDLPEDIVALEGFGEWMREKRIIEWIRVVEMLVALLIWFKIYYFFRLVGEMSNIIQIFFTILARVGWFIVLFVVFIIGSCQAFFLLG